MGTGDLKNCANQLRVVLRQAKYCKDVNYEHLMWGYPREFLPLLHYIFLQYSLRVAKFLLTKGYELSGKSDAVFLDTVYKVMRVEFSYIPKLSKDKFFLNGFAEQKILFVVNVVEKILEKNKNLNKIHAKKKPKKLSRSLKYENGTTDKENCTPNTAPHEQPQTLSQPYPSLPDPDLDDSLFVTASEVPKYYQGGQYSSIEDDHWGQSVILREPTLSEKVYTEAAAKDVYVYPEQAPQYVDEDVDCTPFNTVTTVQHVPITELSPIDVVIVKPDFDLEETILEEDHSNKSSGSCSSCVELQKLVTSLTARLDVLECRVTTLEGPKKVSVLKDQEFAQASHHVTPPNELVGFPKLTVGRTNPVEKLSAEAGSLSDDAETDDLKDFINSIQQRLQSQRSILDNYSSEDT